MTLTLLLSCFSICQSHYYVAGFPHPDKLKCFCSDVVDRRDPPPMQLYLKWATQVPMDERKAIVSEPPPVSDE